MKRYLFFLMLFGTIATISLACRREPREEAFVTVPDVEPQPTVEVPSSIPSPGPNHQPLYGNGTRLPTTVKVSISSASPEPASIQMPAYIETEIAGSNLASIKRLVGRHELDGKLKLVSLEPVFQNSSGSPTNSWLDGSHYLTEVWYPEGYYLTDGVGGDFIVIWVGEPDSPIKTVNGIYRNANLPPTASNGSEAILALNLNDGQSEEVILTKDGRKLSPHAGDTFQLTDLLLEDGGILKPIPGVLLTFDDSGKLKVAKLPLTSGDYFVGLMAQTREGITSAAYANFLVRNDTVRPDMRAFYSPKDGYQFLFPTSWREPEIEPNRLVTGNVTGTITLVITTHPEMKDRPAEELRNKAIENFGEIQILYEDKVSVGSSGALRTVYAYDADDGAHTGVFLSFVIEELAYVIDIDGKAELETSVLEHLDSIANSFVSRPRQAGNILGNWQILRLSDFVLSVPANYHLVSLDNGWHRFDSSENFEFIALRIDRVSESPLVQKMEKWQSLASRGVTEFEYSKIYELNIDNQLWRRIDFSYEQDDYGLTSGNIMATEFDNYILSLWTEAEADKYLDFERDILSIVINSLEKKE
jgi:hypothetical protein